MVTLIPASYQKFISLNSGNSYGSWMWVKNVGSDEFYKRRWLCLVLCEYTNSNGCTGFEDAERYIVGSMVDQSNVTFSFHTR